METRKLIDDGDYALTAAGQYYFVEETHRGITRTLYDTRKLTNAIEYLTDAMCWRYWGHDGATMESLGFAA